MTVFFDTNVLAYQFDNADPVRQARARELLVEHAADAVISTQVLIELQAVLTRKLGRSRSQAATVLDALELEIIATDAALVRRAAHTADEHELSIFDALILEAAVLAGCERLWTEGLTDGSVLRGVQIVNPFR